MMNELETYLCEGSQASVNSFKSKAGRAHNTGGRPQTDTKPHNDNSHQESGASGEHQEPKKTETTGNRPTNPNSNTSHKHLTGQSNGKIKSTASTGEHTPQAPPRLRGQHPPQGPTEAPG